MSKKSAIANILILASPIIFGTCIGVGIYIHSKWPQSSFYVAICFMILGLVTLAYAKFPKFGQRELYSVGEGKTSGKKKLIYILSYTLLLFSFSLILISYLTNAG